MTLPRVRVGDVLCLERVPVEPDPAVEYVSIGIRSFGKGLFHYDPQPGDQLGSLRFFEVRADRLILSNIKGWEGAIAVSSAADVRCIASNRFLSYASVDGRIDVRWAFWYFLSRPGLELIQQASPGSADRNRTLAIARFEAIFIPLPSIDVQLEQVSYLDAVASRAMSISESLQRYQGAALIAMLPYLVDGPLNQAMTARTTVSDVVDFTADVVHPGEDPFPAVTFVGLQHIESHTGRCIGSDSLESLKGRKFRFRPGDVVYGYLRPYLNKVWVADRHGLCSVDQYVLRPRHGVSAELVGHCLRSGEFLDEAVRLTHNLQLPRLRSGLLASVEIRAFRHSAEALVVAELDLLRDRMVGAAARRRHQHEVSAALVPSALNEVFSDLN